MKNRWIGGLALVAALTLAACAPTQQGADETTEPSSAASPAEAEAEHSMDMSSPASGGDDSGGDPDDYDY
jgi:hypothetical protein